VWFSYRINYRFKKLVTGYNALTRKIKKVIQMGFIGKVITGVRVN